MTRNRAQTGVALFALMLSAAALVAAQTRTLPPPARPPKQAPSAPAADAQRALPPAREIIARHVKAIGGRAAILSHSSTRATGTVSVPSSGITGSLEMIAAKPNRSLVRFTLPGVGEMQEGFDGKVGWSMSSLMGPSLIEGKQLEERKLDSDFYSDLRESDQYESITTVERTTFEGRPCYKLRLVRKGGGEDYEFYDVQTGLRAGRTSTREMPMGTVTSTMVESDYRKFGNLLIASQVKQTAMGTLMVLNLHSVEYDKVDAKAFEPPPAIKALLK
jgi:hypothetical protein